MRHRENTMSASRLTTTSNAEDIWFVNSGASNHVMTSYQEWFRDLRDPDRPNYVETGDDTTHPIRHVGNVPFGKEGNQTYIKNVLHVPTIMKNLISVNQMVEQGMQVCLNHASCFVEKEGQLIARGQRQDQMFILESHEVKSVIFSKGPKADANIEPCHKRIGHINLQTIKGMQMKGVLIEIPTFTKKEIVGVCEACHFGTRFQKRET